MSAKVRYVRPEEIMEAVEYAKKQNPKDTLGELAFKFNTDSVRSNKDNTVSYYSWEVYILNADGSRSWVPVKLNAKSVNTCSNIKIENGKGVQLQYRRSSTGVWTIKDETGKPKIVPTPFGEAVYIMATVFPIIVKKKLAKGDINSDNSKIAVPVQLAPKDPKTKKPDMNKKFDDPIIRITIPFPKELNKAIEPDTKPSCKIFDIERPLPAGKKPANSDPAYFIAEHKKGDEEPVPVNYSNISEIIRFGSSTTFIIDFASPTISGMGISMSPKFELILVKRSRGREINVADAFGDQLDDLAETSTVIEPSPDAVPPTNDTKDNKTSGITTDDLDDLDNLGATHDDLGDLGDI